METKELGNRIEVYKNKIAHLEDENIVLKNEIENIKGRIRNTESLIKEYEDKIKLIKEYKVV